MAPFKVIIVGGSVTGMALANMLERYGMDFVVLEKHKIIAPYLGAGFAMQPNGSRILEQLGCYDVLKKLSAPVNSLGFYDEYGNSRGDVPEIGRWMEESMGYKMRFLDRQKVIETLFENLHNKSRVYSSCRVIKIDCSADGVKVETDNGSVFEGDIVVGADGVHSQVLQEMQRLSNVENPGQMTKKKNEFECTYKAMFGTSVAPKNTLEDQAFKNYRHGRSYLCSGGKNNKLYWIAMFRLDQKTQGSSIPRYTQEERDALAAIYKDDLIKPGVTFGDLYHEQLTSALVPLEEGVLETCFYRRMVLMGDSWHKANPIQGQGGNNGIVSAAYLANELKSITESQEVIDEANIQEVFRKYQQKRAPEAEAVFKISRATQRMDALETPLLKFIQLHAARFLPIEVFTNMLAQLVTLAVPLHHLPLPSRRGLLPFDDEVKITPEARSKFANFFWMTLFALILLARYILFWQASDNAQTSSSTSLGLFLHLDYIHALQLYFQMSATAVNGIIVLESYRRGFFMQLLGRSLPFGIGSYFFGWDTVAPVYFTLFVFITGSKSVYYPSPRAVDLEMAKMLPLAYLVTYVPPIFSTLTSSSFPTQAWGIAHVLFPVILYLFKRLYSLGKPALGSPELLYGKQDVQYLRRFMILVYVFQQATSFVLDKSLLQSFIAAPRFVLVSGISREELEVLCLDAAILVFIWFAFWDLRRVRATTHTVGVVLGLAMTLGISLGTTLAVLWAVRESEWEQGRGRQSADEKESELNSAK